MDKKEYFETRYKTHLSKGLCGCGGNKLPQRSKCERCVKTAKDYYIRHKESISSHSSQYAAKIRTKVMSLYGDKCVCCGETYTGFLVLDHVIGGGTRHRSLVDKVYGRGSNFYKWILRYYHNTGTLPNEQLQILCSNCNMAKGINAKCPCPYSLS